MCVHMTDPSAYPNASQHPSVVTARRESDDLISRLLVRHAKADPLPLVKRRYYLVSAAPTLQEAEEKLHSWIVPSLPIALKIEGRGEELTISEMGRSARQAISRAEGHLSRLSASALLTGSALQIASARIQNDYSEVVRVEAFSESDAVERTGFNRDYGKHTKHCSFGRVTGIVTERRGYTGIFGIGKKMGYFAVTIQHPFLAEIICRRAPCITARVETHRLDQVGVKYLLHSLLLAPTNQAQHLRYTLYRFFADGAMSDHQVGNILLMYSRALIAESGVALKAGADFVFNYTKMLVELAYCEEWRNNNQPIIATLSAIDRDWIRSAGAKAAIPFLGSQLTAQPHRSDIVKFLGNLKDSTAVAILITSLIQNGGLGVREIPDALAHIGDPAALEPLLRCLMQIDGEPTILSHAPTIYRAKAAIETLLEESAGSADSAILGRLRDVDQTLSREANAEVAFGEDSHPVLMSFDMTKIRKLAADELRRRKDEV
jgi:hypothetical protein